MKKHVRSFSVFAFLSIIFPIAVQAAPAGEFVEIEGRVDVTRADEAAIDAVVGDKVYVGDIVRTKSDSKATILFSDNSKISISENTRLKITEFIVSKDETKGTLDLFRGKILNIIKKTGKLFGRGKRNSYEVRTPTAIIGVRGTEFFTYHMDGVSGAIFIEGTGYCHNLSTPGIIKYISAGQAMIVANPLSPPKIRHVSESEIQKHLEETVPETDEGESEEEDMAGAEEQAPEEKGEPDAGGESENGHESGDEPQQEGNGETGRKHGEDGEPEDGHEPDDGEFAPEEGHESGEEHEPGEDFVTEEDHDTGEDREPGEEFATEEQHGPKEEHKPGEEFAPEEESGGEHESGEDFVAAEDREPGEDYEPGGDFATEEGREPGEDYEPGGDFATEEGREPGEDYEPGGDFATEEGREPGEDYEPGGDFATEEDREPGEDYEPGGDFAAEEDREPGEEYEPGGDFVAEEGRESGEEYESGGEFAMEEGREPGEEFASEEGYDPGEEVTPEEGTEPNETYLAEDGRETGEAPGGEFTSEEGSEPGGEFELENGHDPDGFEPGEDSDDLGEGRETDDGFEPDIQDDYVPVEDVDPDEGTRPEEEYEPPPYEQEFAGTEIEGMFVGQLVYFRPVDDYHILEEFGSITNGSFWGPEEIWQAGPESPESFEIDGYYDETVSPHASAWRWDQFHSYDDEAGTLETYDGGSFFGIAGGMKLGDKMRGTVLAFYTDPDGNSGFMKGEIDADFDSDEGMLRGDGQIFTVPLDLNLELSIDILENPVYADHETETPDSYHGWFLDESESPVGDIQVVEFFEKRLFAPDSELRISRVVTVGTFESFDDETDWHLVLAGESDNGRWIRDVADTEWIDGRITAKGHEAWVDLEDAMTGISGGDIAGTFDPNEHTWQTVGMWASMDTDTFLRMAETDEGRRNLSGLNIPCIEVGRASLAGSDATMSVTMNDVRFFSYSTGADPKIWATGDVNGAYNAVPRSGHNVTLSGNGLSADFSVLKWEGGLWGASVDGSGTLTRTDIGGSVNTRFSGNCAGNYTGGDSGDFSGTGSGVSGQ